MGDFIFVFGSNLAGRHGKGAALEAVKKYGAKYGVGHGRTGNAYAIPTKDENLKSLAWPAVEHEVRVFLTYAATNPNDLFILTPVGCGLAGGSARRLWYFIASLGVPSNVLFPASWVNDHTLVDYADG